MIGVKRGTVKLVPYDPKWAEVYREEEQLLRSVLGHHVIDIQHVGSTSVEGLNAKPIIDIAIGIKSLDIAESFRSPLEQLGYECRGHAGVEGRVFFAKGSEHLRTHYLHIVVYDGVNWRSYVHFRDYLRRHRGSVKDYSTLKTALAKEFSEERAKYTEAKNEFISHILEKARKELTQDSKV